MAKLWGDFCVILRSLLPAKAMSIAAAEVKQSIYRRWQDSKVAAWVIDQLPLLHRKSQPEVPIYSLRLTIGLHKENQAEFRFPHFRSTPKLVMSGGFEGSGGQLASVNEMWDIRALTSGWQETAIGVLLEPDRYILRKGRRPLVDLSHRKLLWSTSGLVDAVVTLPTKRQKTPSQVHYQHVHDHIKPAKWVSNPENPFALEIVRRGDEGIFDLILLTKHTPRLHTSFLASTQNLTARETRTAAFANLLSMVKRPDLYNTIPKGYVSPRDHAQILFQEISRDL